MVELCGFISYTHRFSDNHDHAGLSRVPLASRRGMEGNKKGEWKEREERKEKGGGGPWGPQVVIHNNVEGRKEMTHVCGVQTQPP